MYHVVMNFCVCYCTVAYMLYKINSTGKKNKMMNTVSLLRYCMLTYLGCMIPYFMLLGTVTNFMHG